MNRKSVPKEPSETRRLERWREGRLPGPGNLRKDAAVRILCSFCPKIPAWTLDNPEAQR